MPSIPLPGSTFTFSVPLVSQASSHIFQAAPTIAAGDFKRSINNGAFANMDNLPTVSPAAGKLVQIVVSAAETTAAGEGGTIDIVGSDAAGAEWDDISICLRVGVIAANAAQLSGDAGAADNLELFFDGTGYASAGSINSVSGTVGSIATDGITAAAVSAAAASKIAAAVIAGGTGTYSYTNTVDDGSGNLLDGVFVQCATDTGFTNIVSTATTNSVGAFTVYSDTAGTHYLRLQFSGITFAIQTVTLA